VVEKVVSVDKVAELFAATWAHFQQSIPIYSQSVLLQQVRQDAATIYSIIETAPTYE
jgi:hypothetical protein